MTSQKQSACQIRQSACGLQEGNPVCPKCGLDVRVGYVSKEDGQFAASMAEAQFWKNEALEKRKAEKVQKQAEAQAQEAERLKAEEAKRQAAKERREKAQELAALEKKKAEQAQRQAEAQAQEAERLKAEEAKRQAAKERREKAQELAALEKMNAEQTQRQVEAQRQEADQLKAEEAKRLAENESKEEGSGGWLKPTVSFVALVLVLGGMSVYRVIDERMERGYANVAHQAMAMASRDEVPAALSPSAPPQPSIKDCNECPELRAIPAGSFQMGSDVFPKDQSPARSVSIKSFEIGKYEVTQGQWKAIMGGNPSYFDNCGDTCPVENVSWNDTQRYIQKLNQRTGQQYRLPSEAEWEYACRGGHQQEYCGSDNADKVAWYGKNSAGTPHPVGQKTPNGYGLYDMSGNAWEWVQDWYHDSYTGAPTDGRAWVTGGEQKDLVMRGGSWFHDSRGITADKRASVEPGRRNYNFGFRLARTLP